MKKILILALILLSCKAQKSSAPDPEEEEKVYILIDGEHVEMVSDEFENQYLKQYMHDGTYIFIPFPFETEEEDSLRILQAKISRYDK